MRFSQKRVFPGEGIMIGLIFAGGNVPLRSGACRRRDLATILADGVALLKTPAVAEPTEVGVELSAEASHVVTGIRSASRPLGVQVGRGRHARDPRGGVEAGDVMTVPLAGQPGHGITASVRRQPARIVEGPGKAATGTPSRSSAATAVTTPTGITPRSRWHCSGSAGPTPP